MASASHGQQHKFNRVISRRRCLISALRIKCCVTYPSKLPCLTPLCSTGEAIRLSLCWFYQSRLSGIDCPVRKLCFRKVSFTPNLGSLHVNKKRTRKRMRSKKFNSNVKENFPFARCECALKRN